MVSADLSTSVSISCSSDLAVQTMQWLDSEGHVVSNSSGQQQLELVTADNDGTTYTCEVRVMLASGVATITETINCKNCDTFNSDLYISINAIFHGNLTLHRHMKRTQFEISQQMVPTKNLEGIVTTVTN